jgi:hypothetical protein
LGDTFVKFPNEVDWEDTRSFVLLADVKESYRWCLAEVDEDGLIEQMIDKPRDYPQPMKALIGVYAIEDWPLLMNCFKGVLERRELTREHKMEISDGLNCYKSERELAAYNCEDWYDCGNPDNLMQSRRRLLQARAFNQVSFDDTLGTITKRSQRTEKFTDEIQYYQLLPDDLRSLFPRIINSDAYASEPFLEMEYYGYPTLAEMFVFENLSHHIWRQIFEHLYAIVERFRRYTRQADGHSFDYMYQGRVKERLTVLRESEWPVAKVIDEYSELIINGKQYKNFDAIWPRIQRVVRAISCDKEFTVIHGDLCFSNILYDLNSRVCKLIDPRGSFGQKGVYGDIRYDIAKLYHSVHGLYDYITNDLFSLQIDDNCMDFEVYAPEEVKRIQKAFDQVFFGSFNPSEIILLEGLLFVTMGVFHYDHPHQQVAMYLTGIRMWNEVLKHENLS